MNMIVYNLLNHLSRNLRIVIKTADDDEVLFDNSINYLLTERKDLLQLSIYSCCSINYLDDDKIKYHIDKNNTCDIKLIIRVNKPNIISKISYYLLKLIDWIKTNVCYDMIKRVVIIKIIRIIFNKWYDPECNLPLMTNYDIPAVVTKTNVSRVIIYSRDIWLMHDFKYKYPIFRIYVLDHNESYKYLGFISSYTEYADATMIFTLEPNPRWLQDYDKIKYQLQGNIISKEEIQRLVDFVKDNYGLFKEAWDTNTYQFGTHFAGFDITKIKPIK